jgi:hypothetical protein
MWLKNLKLSKAKKNKNLLPEHEIVAIFVADPGLISVSSGFAEFVLEILSTAERYPVLKNHHGKYKRL